jgi:uncharacterized protein (TIGR03437 family)
MFRLADWRPTLGTAVVLWAACHAAAFGQAVGSGAPTTGIQSRFVNAFNRNGFANLVTLPPLGDVRTFGGTGLVQEFQDAQKNKYALILPDVSAPVLQDAIDVIQLTPGLYSFYTSVGPTTAGLPTTDSLPCPALSVTATCQYELFTKDYALFVFGASSQVNGTTFATRDPFYTKWSGLGGIATLGPAVSAEQTIMSFAGTAATGQTFDRGAVFNITSGTLNGRLVAVGPIVYPLYGANKGSAGFLGLPVADETTLSNGHRRQSFEGGSIEYDSSGVPVLRYPVSSISVNPSSSKLNLNLGDSLVLTATPFDPNGNPLSDRTISWSTSNSRVVSIQPSGATVTIKAVGGGSATITASSEAKSSLPIGVFVAAPCCDLGEGAPTPAIQQAFQDAIARNRVKLQLPAPGPVQRLGNGYVQDARDTQGTAYLITVADRAATGYVGFGPLLSKYLALGGPSGSLGYPVADATSGGTQLFQNRSALSGNPPLLVAGAILSKWAALGYETGAAGAPVSEASTVLSFRGTLGQAQSFASGAILAVQTGPLSGKAYFVAGPVLRTYVQSGGAGGQLGFPADDEYSASGKRRQDFEGGFVDYASGDEAGQIHLSDRVPIITATPAVVLAGTRLRISAGGFGTGSTLRVSVSGQPDFSITTDNGAYSWEIVVPASAKTGTVSIRAVDTRASSVSASGSYTVRAIAETQFKITRISGDGQTGLPAAVLPQSLKIAVLDDSGNAAAGIPVSFSASPGAQIVSPSALTDGNGQAEAMLRLQPSDGVALATAQAGRQVVTFSAQAVHSSLAGFPSFTQVADVPLGKGTETITSKGSLLASAASVVRYYQNRGLLPTPNGFADPQTLNQFLKSFCVFDAQGAQICDGFVTPADSQEQFVNLWRVGAFAGNGLDVSIESRGLDHIRDLLAQSVPVIIALALTAQGNPVGGHYVVATGVAADGSISIADPNPTFGRSSLADYLAGFGSVKGTIAGAIRLVPRTPLSKGFLATGTPVFQIISPAGSCDAILDLPSVNATAAAVPATAAQLRFVFCDGTQSVYELDAATDDPFRITLTDLGDIGNRQVLSNSGSVAYKIARAGAQWSASPQVLSFAANGIVNAASFTPDLAPGGLFAVFGSGLSSASVKTTAQIGGLDAPVVASTPFQINAQIPPDLAPGTYRLHLTSPFGDAEQPVSIKDVAPEIFTLPDGTAAILNQNGSLNAPDNPAKRGEAVVIFCTGLGAVSPQRNLLIARTPVSATIGRSEPKPFFAGLTPGFIGLYQVNVILLIDTPPGVNLPLRLSQGGTTSNTVLVSIQ